jgi:hypothetical protein
MFSVAVAQFLVVRRFMATRLFTPIFLLTFLAATGCHSPHSHAPASQTSVSQAQFDSESLPFPFRLPPSNLPTFGSQTTNSIRIAVFGMQRSVNRPGYYHLPSGAVVRDAVRAAQGVDESTGWTRYSGLIRQKPGGKLEIIRYKSDQFANEQIPLKDGDSLFFGHEVY